MAKANGFFMRRRQERQLGESSRQMALRVVCLACTRPIEYSKAQAGQRVKCPYCFNPVEFPPFAPRSFAPLESLGGAAPASRSSSSADNSAVSPASTARLDAAAERGDLICADCGTMVTGFRRNEESLVNQFVHWLYTILSGALARVGLTSTQDQACANCGSVDVTPLASLRGQELLARFQR